MDLDVCLLAWDRGRGTEGKAGVGALWGAGGVPGREPFAEAGTDLGDEFHGEEEVVVAWERSEDAESSAAGSCG